MVASPNKKKVKAVFSICVPSVSVKENSSPLFFQLLWAFMVLVFREVVHCAISINWPRGCKTFATQLIMKFILLITIVGILALISRLKVAYGVLKQETNLLYSILVLMSS